jgi:maltose O-acetyltransferase
VTIGNMVFIGAGSIILPGTSMGDNSIIGAGSVVTRDIPPNTVAAGNPARAICTIDEFLTKQKRQMEMFPCFGEEYTLKKNVSLSMRKEMNRQMDQRIGYIV